MCTKHLSVARCFVRPSGSTYLFNLPFYLFTDTLWDLSLKMGTDEIQILFQKQILRIIVLPIGDTNIYE